MVQLVLARLEQDSRRALRDPAEAHRKLRPIVDGRAIAGKVMAKQVRCRTDGRGPALTAAEWRRLEGATLTTSLADVSRADQDRITNARRAIGT